MTEIDENALEEKIKLYLDTSIPSSYYDTSKPVRQLITQKWFENKASLYDLYFSATAIDEIDELSNVVKRQNIKGLILDYNMQVLELSEETKANGHRGSTEKSGTPRKRRQKVSDP